MFPRTNKHSRRVSIIKQRMFDSERNDFGRKMLVEGHMRGRDLATERLTKKLIEPYGSVLLGKKPEYPRQSVHARPAPGLKYQNVDDYAPVENMNITEVAFETKVYCLNVQGVKVHWFAWE